MAKIHEAVTQGNIDEVRRQLAEGADVNAKDDQGRTPLLSACAHVGNLDAITNRVLAEQSKGPLPARRPRYIDIMKLLVENGADVNERCTDGLTALRVVALNGDAEAMKLLIESGVDIREDGRAALLVAADGDHTEVVRLLAENGADVSLKTKDGVTALMHMACGGHADIVKLLIEKGADVNAKSKEGLTALRLLVQEGHTEVAALLREHGAG